MCRTTVLICPRRLNRCHFLSGMQQVALASCSPRPPFFCSLQHRALCTPKYLLLLIYCCCSNTYTIMAADADWVFWAPKWQGRLKAFTLVACTAAVVSSATADWESQFGEQHCFHGVKPGLKRMLNSIFGVSDATSGPSIRPQAAAAEP